MAAQRGFFSWWFGELREVFSGRSVPVHALALSAHEVALVEKGVDAPLGVVDTQAEDWLEQIEGLRSRILRRKGRNPLIEVQLPSEQVMFAKVEFPPKGNREQALVERLESITGQDPESLVFDIASKAETDGNTVVAIAPASTVTEAARYASEWGFDSARITSIESPAAFRRGPDFDYDGARAVGSKLPKIAAGLFVVALVVAGIAAVKLFNIRAQLAEDSLLAAQSVVVDSSDLGARELDLAEYAHAAATATDLRDVSMPLWRLMAEAASIMPDDVALSGFEYGAGQLVLRGTTASTVALEEALDRSPIFNAPTLSSTSRSSSGRAKFVIEAAVDERSIR